MAYVGRFFNIKDEENEYRIGLEREPLKIYYDLRDQKYVCHKISTCERASMPDTALDMLYKSSKEEFDGQRSRYYKYDKKNRDERFEGIKNILKQNLEKQKEFDKALDNISDSLLSDYIDMKKKDSITAERARAKRYIRKAGMNRKDLNYFVTITRDTNLYADEEDWMRALCRWCANNSFRYGIKIMGGFEFGDDNGRLHFHAVAHIPDGFFSPGDLRKVSRYSEKDHKWRNVMECVELRNKFGINEFEYLPVSESKEFLNVLTYVSCYAAKDGGKMYYSRGLPDHIETYINADDLFFEFCDGIVKYRLFDGWEKNKFGSLVRFKRIIPTSEIPFDEAA